MNLSCTCQGNQQFQMLPVTENPILPQPPFQPVAPFVQTPAIPFINTTPHIEGACGHNSFLCQQSYTGSRLRQCCTGQIQY